MVVTKANNESILDFSSFRVFSSPNGAEFCPRTGFLFIPHDCGTEEGSMNSPEFVHETFHYLTSMMTSAGYFLSCLRYTRAMIIRRHIQEIEPIFSEKRNFKSLNARRIEKIKLTQLNQILDMKNDDISSNIYYITKMRLGELAFLKMSEVLHILEAVQVHPVALILECLSDTQKQLNYRYNIQTYWSENGEKFSNDLLKNILKDYSLPASKEFSRVIDTYDIFEAFSLMADISYLSNVQGRDAAINRIEIAMKSDEYSIVLTTICSRFDIEFTPQDLENYSPFFMMLLDLSLDVQTLPHSSILLDLPSWHDIYPPAKLVALLEYCDFHKYEIQNIKLDELILLRNLLKSQFKQPKAEANIKQQPSFFEFLRHLEEGSNESEDVLQNQSKSYDILDYYSELYFSFKKHEFNSQIEGISNQFHTGFLNQFAYNKPPMIFSSGKSYIAPHMLSEHFLDWRYQLFSNTLAMEDYLFNFDHVSIFPINKKLYQEGPWYETQISIFLSNLEGMKQSHQN